MLEKFQQPKHIEGFTKYSLEDLEWNLQNSKDELERLLSSGGAEMSKVQELEDMVSKIKEEIHYRIQNN